MFVVDTNVLVYAADVRAMDHDRYRSLVERWRSQPTPWFLTWNVVYEFLRIATHPSVFRNPWTAASAWSFVDALVASPGLTILCEGDRHTDVVRDLIRRMPDLRGNLVHDAHTVAVMQEHGIRTIYTRDTDFHRFPSVEVRDPLTEG